LTVADLNKIIWVESEIGDVLLRVHIRTAGLLIACHCFAFKRMAALRAIIDRLFTALMVGLPPSVLGRRR